MLNIKGTHVVCILASLRVFIDCTFDVCRGGTKYVTGIFSLKTIFDRLCLKAGLTKGHVWTLFGLSEKRESCVGYILGL